MSTYGTLVGAREALAAYDAPRCPVTMTRGEHTYRCCLFASFDHEKHDFALHPPSAVSVVHLRAALARVDELEGAYKDKPGEIVVLP